MLRVRCSIRTLGVALCLLPLASSSIQAREHAALAYVVSPPPATREVMPRYLPRLPPETTARIPQTAAGGAHRVRAGLRRGHRRSRHIRRCTPCRHRARNPGVPRCDPAGHCNHRHRRAEQHRWRPFSRHGKAANGIGGRPGGHHRRNCHARNCRSLAAGRGLQDPLDSGGRLLLATSGLGDRLEPGSPAEMRVRDSPRFESERETIDTLLEGSRDPDQNVTSESIPGCNWTSAARRGPRLRFRRPQPCRNESTSCRHSPPDITTPSDFCLRIDVSSFLRPAGGAA
jgi:hypothetical protein